MAIPRSEYPRPQFVRQDWLCLNGPWQFEIDGGDSGLERGLLDRELAGKITVPFCPESTLSGVGNIDFLNAVWYRRTVDVPAAWAGKRVLLHFQAVDYDATVWADGRKVGRHRGGFTPFSCDLGDVGGKAVTIVVRARDLKSTADMARGKQSARYGNHGCLYTRTTGIWQTVWMEPVPATHLLRPRITPDVANGMFRLVEPITNSRPGTKLRVALRDSAGAVATAQCRADGDFTPQLDLVIPESRRRLWSPKDPHLYDLDIELVDSGGAVIDRAASYAGLRSVTIEGRKVLLNGRSVFQRLVLDQGYYPDGILTAPTDEALRRDIELSLAAGFNGARLHQKVFEERFLYHADRMGYLVWGEFGDWGIDRERPGPTMVTQWLEALHRDFSHPSIIGWCALNETAKSIRDEIDGLEDLTCGLFLAAKAMDPTRPVLDASGYSHRIAETDIYDCHDYTQDPPEFARRQAGLAEGNPFTNGSDDKNGPWSLPYAGQPFFVSEFGGTWWNAQAVADERGKRTTSWGYGQRPANVEEFYDRFEKLTAVLLDNSEMFGYCYTQLTDVYQEQNGIYNFDRTAKFDMTRIAAAQKKPAAIEKR